MGNECPGPVTHTENKGEKDVVSTAWKLRGCHVGLPTKGIKNLPKPRSRFRKWFEKNPSWCLTCSRGDLCGPQHPESVQGGGL